MAIFVGAVAIIIAAAMIIAYVPGIQSCSADSASLPVYHVASGSANR